MCRSRGLIVILAGALVLAGALPVRGQRRGQSSDRSHILLPGGDLDQETAEKMLTARLHAARDLQAAKTLLDFARENPDLLKDLQFDPKDLAKIREQFKDQIPPNFNPDDPDFRKLAEQFKDPKFQERFSEDDRERFERLMENFKRTLPDQPGGNGERPGGNGERPGGNGQPNPVDPPEGNQPGGDPNGRRPGPGQTRPAPPGTAPAPPPPPPPRPSPASPSKTGEIGKRIRESLGGLIGSDSRLGQWTRNLGKNLLPDINSSRITNLARRLIPKNFRFSPPRVGKFERPTMGGIRLPSVSAPSGDGVGRAFGFLLLGVAVLAVLGWLLARSGQWAAAAERRWRLGPWPVDPSAVRTRGDLVQAFEYLAMLRLGQEAVPANHLEIAEQLGSDPSDLTGRHRHAAEELAYLYEHARYAPPEEDLSADEVHAARRDLSFLAGVTAA